MQINYVQEKIVQKAYEFLGTPYKYGGTDKNGVDCSGLSYAVYKAVTGQSLPRAVATLYEYGEKVTAQLLPGDLLFFDTVGGPSHVGIYIGNNNLIHAASAGPKLGVIISSLNEDYYKTRYLGARRVITQQAPSLNLKISAVKQETSLLAPLQTGIPLYFYITQATEKNQFITFSLYNDSNKIIEKRLRFSGQSEQRELWFIPHYGTWKAIISENANGEVYIVSFTVEGGA